MFYQLRYYVILQLQALIYGCQKLDVMFFAFGINFLSVDWQPKHITLNLLSQ